MASFAGIRRTSSALDRLIERGNLPSVAIQSFSPAAEMRRVAELLDGAAGVDHAVPVVAMVGREDVEKNWWFVAGPLGDDAATPVMTDGREPRDDAPDELAVSRHTAEKFDLGVGSTFTIGFYTPQQLMGINQNSSVDPAGPRIAFRVVGVYLDPRDVEQSATSTAVRASAAFASAYEASSAFGGVLVTPSGAATTAMVADAVDEVGSELGLSEELGNALEVEDQLAPARNAARETRTVVVLGLVAFAAAAFVAGLVAHAQALRRWMGRSDGAQQSLAAMGARQVDRRAALVLSVAPHVVVAALASVLSSWLLSPLFPIGVLRDLEPDPGRQLDGLVTAIGVVATVAVLALLVVGVSVLAARRESRDRIIRSEHPVIRAAERTNAPVPALVGIRYAVRPGRAAWRSRSARRPLQPWSA